MGRRMFGKIWHKTSKSKKNVGHGTPHKQCDQHGIARQPPVEGPTSMAERVVMTTGALNSLAPKQTIGPEGWHQVDKYSTRSLSRYEHSKSRRRKAAPRKAKHTKRARDKNQTSPPPARRPICVEEMSVLLSHASVANVLITIVIVVASGLPIAFATQA